MSEPCTCTTACQGEASLALERADRFCRELLDVVAERLHYVWDYERNTGVCPQQGALALLGVA